MSAIKVDGKRAYQRVRDGEDVSLKARPVTVHELDVHDVRAAGEHLDVDVTLRCSSGTYVRAIARDVGARLGVGGHLTALRRTAVGPFALDDAHTLETLGERVRDAADRRRRPGQRSRAASSTRRAPTTSASAGALDLDLDGADRGLRPRRRVPGPLRAARGRGPRGRGLRLGRSPGRGAAASRLPPVHIWRSLEEVPADLGRTAVVIGNFDGVHLGHRQVLARAREVADERGAGPGRGDLRPAPDGGAAPRARAGRR